LETLPVIIITGRDDGDSEFMIAVMKDGYPGKIDYIRKPVKGDRLDKAIEDALSKRPGNTAAVGEVPLSLKKTPLPASPLGAGHGDGNGYGDGSGGGHGNGGFSANIAAISEAPLSLKKVPSPSSPQSFTKGELVFFPDRIELCSVKILSDTGLGHTRKMLELLRAKRRDGRFVRLGAEQIAAKIDPAATIQTVTGCASTIRRNIKTRLKKDPQKIECQDNDVLVRDEQGYYLNDEKITVRDGDENASTDGSGDISEASPNEPTNIDDLNERQKWVLEEVRKGHGVQRKHVESRFDVSEKTAKRDFSELIKLELIEFVRKPHPGEYREHCR
jgi:hypothetical protein